MELTLSTCFIVVDDPDRALAIYRDALGLELRQDVANQGCRWITVGAGSQPGVAIVLTHSLNRGPADRGTIRELVDQGAASGVHCVADDLDAAFEKVSAAGAEITQEPTAQP